MSNTVILEDLAKGLPAITSEFGASLAQAGAVCFENQSHTSGTQLSVNGEFNARYQVFWQKVTTQSQRCWNDLKEATEYGAYGIAILLIIDLTQYTVIEKSKRGTGFDFWLGTDEDNELPFQNKARLEVSGILKGNVSNVNTRAHKKVKQVQPSDDTMKPAYIVIVEFSTPITQVVKK